MDAYNPYRPAYSASSSRYGRRESSPFESGSGRTNGTGDSLTKYVAGIGSIGSGRTYNGGADYTKDADVGEYTGSRYAARKTRCQSPARDYVTSETSGDATTRYSDLENRYTTGDSSYRRDTSPVNRYTTSESSYRRDTSPLNRYNTSESSYRRDTSPVNRYNTSESSYRRDTSPVNRYTTSDAAYKRDASPSTRYTTSESSYLRGTSPPAGRYEDKPSSLYSTDSYKPYRSKYQPDDNVFYSTDRYGSDAEPTRYKSKYSSDRPFIRSTTAPDAFNSRFLTRVSR